MGALVDQHVAELAVVQGIDQSLRQEHARMKQAGGRRPGDQRRGENRRQISDAKPGTNRFPDGRQPPHVGRPGGAPQAGQHALPVEQTQQQKGGAGGPHQGERARRARQTSAGTAGVDAACPLSALERRGAGAAASGSAAAGGGFRAAGGSCVPPSRRGERVEAGGAGRAGIGADAARAPSCCAATTRGTAGQFDPSASPGPADRPRRRGPG